MGNQERRYRGGPTPDDAGNARGDVLVCGCRPADLAVLRESFRAAHLSVRSVDSPVELARLVVRRRPVALVLGVAASEGQTLEVIAVVRGVWGEVPTIVVAEDDSLELERQARQTGIFYYFVRPLENREVRAVIRNLLARRKSVTGRISEKP